MTWVINPAVGCHYFPPSPQLSSQPLRGLLPVLLLGERRHDGCEQFAQDCYPTALWLRFEPRPFCAWVQHANHSATEPLTFCKMSTKNQNPTALAQITRTQLKCPGSSLRRYLWSFTSASWPTQLTPCWRTRVLCCDTGSVQRPCVGVPASAKHHRRAERARPNDFVELSAQEQDHPDPLGRHSGARAICKRRRPHYTTEVRQQPSVCFQQMLLFFLLYQKMK